MVCTKCGLPEGICSCAELEKALQKIEVSLEQKRYGKDVTVISGIGPELISGIAKQLKSRLACGGTVKNGKIELQGNHLKKIREELVRCGFAPEAIEIK